MSQVKTSTKAVETLPPLHHKVIHQNKSSNVVRRKQPIPGPDDPHYECAGNLLYDDPHKWVPLSTFEYRHYVPFHPCSNKLLSKRWDKHARDLHLTKLKQARPTIDNLPPKVYPHLEMRLKRLQIEEERLHDIERKNHNLLDRIAFQMVNPSEVSGLDASKRYVTAPCPGGQGQPGVGGSLHAPKRRRDMVQIAVENLTNLQRLEDKAPYYNRLEWLAERHRNVGYLLNIAQYPETYKELIKETSAVKTPFPPGKPRTTLDMHGNMIEGEFSRGATPKRPVTRPSNSGGQGPLEEEGWEQQKQEQEISLKNEVESEKTELQMTENKDLSKRSSSPLPKIKNTVDCTEEIQATTPLETSVKEFVGDSNVEISPNSEDVE